jgi:hypothetical protein
MGLKMGSYLMQLATRLLVAVSAIVEPSSNLALAVVLLVLCFCHDVVIHTTLVVISGTVNDVLNDKMVIINAESLIYVPLDLSPEAC